MSGTNQVLSVALAAVLIVGLFAGTVVAAGASGGDGALAAATQGLGVTDQDDADDPSAVAPSEMNVSYGEALATARAQLAHAGGYALTDVDVGPDGYEFEFAYRENSTVGEAEVEIDGATGAVVESEQEYEADDDHDPTVRIAVVEGTPAPGANVTAELTLDGEELAGTQLRLNGDAVGETGENGTVQVTLSDGSESTLSAQVGDAEGELEFEFEDEAEDENEDEEDENENEEDENEEDENENEEDDDDDGEEDDDDEDDDGEEDDDDEDDDEE